MNTPDTQLSPRKQLFFRLLLILFPFAFLVSSELLLRALDYGSDDAFIKTKIIGHKQMYVVNRRVANRYFAYTGTTVPEPSDDPFEVVKAPNTKRIFCLGESTMAGFPYEFNATAPSFLRDRLRSELFGYNIEVINVGLAAVSSYVVLDLIREFVQYQPDLFVVYLGHNEFYGIYGAGSAITIPGGRWIANMTLQLLRSRLYVLLRDGIHAAGELISPSKPAPKGTLMEQMASEQFIPFGSQKYREARKIYEMNLRDIIGVAQSQGVPIIFSDLVSNSKDHPPFRTLFDTITTSSSRQKWAATMMSGDSAFTSGNFTLALSRYKECIRLDTMNATAFFKLGQTLLRLHNVTEARTELLRAKDLDVLRFRATEEFQEILREVCARLNVPLAPVDSIFRSHSPDGIIGPSLMVEHLHPNIGGYFLMGKAFGETIRNRGFLVYQNTWTATPASPDDVLLKASHVTYFDTLVGSIRIDLLKHQWPFSSQETRYEYTPHDNLERIAYEYVRGRLFWSTARYDAAEFYRAMNQFENARKECLAVAKVIPTSYQPLLRVADYYRMEGKTDSARTWYHISIQAEDNPYARMKLALILLDEENASAAADEIVRALALSTMPQYRFTTSAAASAHYLLGVAYAQLGKFAEARGQLDQALLLDPTQADARDLQKQILPYLTPK